MTAQSSISKTVLPNGIRILSERVTYVDSVSVGVWTRAGSRDEVDSLRGISHFVEHMLFKGTERRSARQIADEMDGLGGHLNAFTDKEFTCYYAKVLREHLNAAMNIISDMVLNSRFDPVEIEREKNVVLEEIKRHRDTPEDNVHDLLAETIWRGHRLGNSVIGTSEAVRALTRQSLLDYLRTYYRPDALVISAAGNIEHQDLVDIVSRAFGDLEGARPASESVEATINPEVKLVEKSTEQVHFCLGTRGFSQDCRRKYALAAIDSVLGGGMSSRLFQEIREARGLAYAIGSYSAAYKEAGLFAVYGGTSMSSVADVLEITLREFRSVAEDSVTEDELVRAKNQIRGALVLGQESMSNRMSRLAKSEMYFGRMIRLEEIINSILQVDRDCVAEVAGEIFRESEFALVAVGPFSAHPELTEASLLPARS